MRLRMSGQSPLKRPFLLAGVAFGAMVSVRYLYVNHLRGKLPGSPGVPDPVWTQFVNVALILFVAIYCANLARRIVEFVIKKDKRGRRT